LTGLGHIPPGTPPSSPYGRGFPEEPSPPVHTANATIDLTTLPTTPPGPRSWALPTVNLAHHPFPSLDQDWVHSDLQNRVFIALLPVATVHLSRLGMNRPYCTIVAASRY
jgi:hypothetical protein